MKKPWTAALVVAGCLAVAALRFLLPPHGLQAEDAFKDAAHLWVGGLYGAALARPLPWLWACALGLTAVEVLAFFLTR